MSSSDEFVIAPSDLEDAGGFTPTEANSGRRWGARMIVPLAAVAVVALAAAALKTDLIWPRKVERQALSTVVHPGDLVVTVTEDGTLESASNIDIKSKVSGQTAILSIVKDGTQVKEGDELVRLDSAALEDQINQQTIAFEKAQSAQIEARNDFAAAKIAVREYEEGTFLQQLQVAQENVTIALENLRSSENTFQHTERMARKGYVTSLQRDAQSFAVERAKLDLEVARTAQRVLEDFSKAKMLGDLKSKQDTSEAKLRSAEAAFKLEEARLTRFTNQLKECVIVAPRDGLVVYANEFGGRGGQPQTIIDEGVLVRERQSILRLPDLTQMQAKVAIHESRVNDLEIGMRARVRIQEREFQGTVTFIANQADAGDCWVSNVKKYATLVRIDGSPDELLPGMTASVEILVGDRKNVLSVPVEAVVEQDDEFQCWVYNSASQVEKRTIKLGKKNLTHVEVASGLNDGDQVLLDPSRFIADSGKGPKKPDTVDVKKRFGEQAAVAGQPNSVRSDRNVADAAGSQPGGGGQFNIMQFDKDGDKRVSREEAPDQMRSRFDSMDRDHDGFIDPAEAAKWAAETRNRRASAGAGGEAPDGPRGADRGSKGGRRGPGDEPRGTGA